MDTTETLTAEQTIVRGLQLLAGVCDGAQARDDAGFNAVDTTFGHDLATKSTYLRLSPAQLRVALKLLRTYHAQLERSWGLVLPSNEAFEAEMDARRGQQLPPEVTLDASADGRVVVRFAAYDAAGVAAVKAVGQHHKGARWNNAQRQWELQPSAITALVEALPRALQTDAFRSLRRAHRDALDEAAEAEALEAARKASITRALLANAGDLAAPRGPEGITLFAHQREGVTRLLEAQRAILADEMGLGKTLEALVAAAAFDLPIFVVAPVSLHDNWRREAARVGVRIELYSWAAIPEPPRGAFVLVADEAHYAQTYGWYTTDEATGERVYHGTRRTADFLDLALAESCEACYLCTGTPMKNGRPSNLFPLLKAIRHELGKSKKGFEKRYCNGHEEYARGRTFWDATGAAHMDELHERTRDVLIRRLKKDCLDLPAKLRTRRVVELSPAAQEVFDRALDAMRTRHAAMLAEKRRLDPEADLSEGEALVELTQYRAANAQAKVEAAAELAQEILEEGESVVLYSSFKEALLGVENLLTEEGARCVLLTGDTPTEERDGLVQQFQRGDANVFLMSSAGGVGITLTKASHVILLDRPWTPGDAEQVEDRCHRIGQTGTVNAYWLQSGDIDEKVDDILEQKAERIALFYGGKRKTLRGIQNPTEVARALLQEALFPHERREEEEDERE